MPSRADIRRYRHDAASWLKCNCLHDGLQELRTMVRTAKPTKTTKPAVRGRMPGRPAPVGGKTPAKATKLIVAPKRAAIVPVSTGRKQGRPAAAAAPAKVPAKAT